MKEGLSKLKDVFDVVIVGGGIIGTAASISLRQLGLKVAIIEKSDLSNFKPGESLSPECKRFLRSINFALNESVAIEYTGISSIWGNSRIAMHDFIYNPFGNGLAIDRVNFERNLIEYSEKAGSRIFLHTKIDDIHYDNFKWHIKTVTGQIKRLLRSRYLILATGRFSGIKLKLSKRTFFDKLIALSKIIDSNPEINNKTLRIESLSNGWFYTNLLPKNKRAHTIFTDNDLIPKSKSREEYFWETVAGTTWFEESELAAANKNGRFYAFDARTFWTAPQCGDGWLYLGDAAYSIDPLSGQGIKKNLDMIEFLKEIIESLISGNKKAMESYNYYNTNNFTNYLQQRRKVYSAETKWSLNDFWMRRFK